MITIYFISFIMVCSDGTNAYHENPRTRGREVAEYEYKVFTASPYTYPSKGVACKFTNVQLKSERAPNI